MYILHQVIKMKKKYTKPTITEHSLDTEISLLMHSSYPDPGDGEPSGPKTTGYNTGARGINQNPFDQELFKQNKF